MTARRSAALLLVIGLLVTAYRLWVIRHLGIDLYVDEAYYWGWSKALDWGYFSKPPVIAALIAASTAAFGDGILAVKLPALLLYPATSLVLAALGTRLFDARIGFWSGLAFLTMPLVGALGLFVSTDAPLLFFWSLGMLFLLRALEHQRWRDWLGLGLAVGLGLLSKYTMAAFLPSALLVMLMLPRGRRALVSPRPWLALLLALAVFAPNLWWNWQNDFPTLRHTAAITHVDDGVSDSANLGEFLVAQLASFGPLLSIGLIWALFSLRTVWRGAAAFQPLLAFCLPLLLLVGAQAASGGANGNWAAPAYVAGTILTIAFWIDSGRRTWAICAVALNTVLVSLIYHWPDLTSLAGVEMTRSKDPYKRARGWHELASGVAPALRSHPEAILVAGDRELLAQLIYFDRPKEYASWNPAGNVIDHYQLTTTLRDKVGRDVLLVSRSPSIDAITARFASSELVGNVKVDIYRDFGREVHVFLLRDFKGYE